MVDDQGVEAAEAGRRDADEIFRQTRRGGIACYDLDAVFAVLLLELVERGGGARGQDELVRSGLGEEVVRDCETDAWDTSVYKW